MGDNTAVVRLLSLVVLLACCALQGAQAGGTEQFYKIGKEQWEKEYSKGDWEYLDKQAIERARASVIVSMFYDVYGGGAFGSTFTSTFGSSASSASSTSSVSSVSTTATPALTDGAVGSVAGTESSAVDEPPVQHLLDVGCGPGTLSDYLRGPQRKMYEGIDLSTIAIETARRLRAFGMNAAHLMHAGVRPLKPEQFHQADCMEFEPPLERDGKPRRYGTIVFNEMLYYTDHKKVLQRYQSFLKPGGIFIISVWFNKEKSLRDTIFADARLMFDSVDEVEFTGVTYTGKKKTRMPVSFHVEAFRVKEQQQT